MPSPEQLQEWHKLFTRIERVDDYHKLKELHSSTTNQIEELNENIAQFQPPRNPREDAIQCHSKTKLDMLKKQKVRLEKQLETLALQIQTDMEVSRQETL